MEVSSQQSFPENDADARVDSANPADDTILSPYNSPQKEFYNPEMNCGSGDFKGNAVENNTENDHSIANYAYSASSEDTAKRKSSLDNHILKGLQMVSESLERNVDLNAGDASRTGCIKSDSGIVITDDKLMNGLNTNTQEHSQHYATGAVIGSPVDNVKLTDPAPISSPEEEKEKIIAEMLASATDTTPNAELTQSEMLSISKRMEEEFRTMVMEEQQKKKISIEGPSFAANGNLSSGDFGQASKESTNKQSSKGTTPLPIKSSKLTKSRLPTSQSRTGRPNSARVASTPTAQSKGTPVSSTRSATSTTKPRGTPTTFRITPKAASHTQSSREQRTPSELSTTQINPSSRKANSSRIPNVAITPAKATPSTLRSPRSATPGRSPLSTPHRPPSSQSSDSGRANMPTRRNVQSKIGSLQNARHTPGGGNVKIESKRLNYSSVGSKCGSLANASYTPGGGKVKIESKKVDYSHVSSKCGSMGNITHTPGGGRVRVEHRKLDFTTVSSKCGSKDNMKHAPQGGNVKIFHKKQNFANVTGRIGSMDNVSHSPGGGKVKIFHARVDTSKVQPKVGSKDNLKHTPGGGKVKILNRSIDMSHIKSKCGSMDNADHVAGGGNVAIFDEALAFRDTAKAKIGSLDNADYVPGGGDVRIYDEKLHFKEYASPRTDHGFNGLGSQGSSGSISPM